MGCRDPGTVVLSGFMASSSMKEAARRCAEVVGGVESVEVEVGGTGTVFANLFIIGATWLSNLNCRRQW